MKPIGANFFNELKAAGLSGLPFSWQDDGHLSFSEAMTPQQIMAVNAVYEAHNPATATLNLAENKKRFVKQIDADTDAVIGAVIGNRESEYELAEAQATAYAAAGYTGTAPAYVQSWADAKAEQAWTAQTAADDILATANAWRTAQAALRAQRLLRKEQAKNAADAAALDTVAAQWAGFLSAVKAQLGVS